MDAVAYALASQLKLGGDSWAQKSDMPTGRYGLGVAAINGIIYAVGGYKPGTGLYSGENESYDPKTDTWTTKASMPSPRLGLAVAVANNRLFAINGRVSSAVSVVEEYDPVENRWYGKNACPISGDGSRATVCNGYIYLIGGGGGGGKYNYQYDPNTDTWVQKADMPTSRYYLGVESIDGKVYACGGYSTQVGGGSYVVHNEMYDPNTNTWTTKAAMTQQRGYFASGTIDGELYAAGGTSGGANHLTHVEKYNPSKNFWIRLVDTPVGRKYTAGAVIGKKLYVVGGEQHSLNRIDEYSAISIQGLDTLLGYLAAN